MPLFIDVHEHVEGLTAEAVTQADLKTQAKYNVESQRYWFDEGTGKVFCLVQAPNEEAAMAVHREAHALVADSLTELKRARNFARRSAAPPARTMPNRIANAPYAADRRTGLRSFGDATAISIPCPLL
jgi:Protein of unknown function (DUF4242)